MSNLKRIWKKHWAWILGGGLFLIFGIPLLIHILFTIPAPHDFFRARWTAGDVLVFYGAIIGAIVLFVSIYLIQKNHRESIQSLEKNYHEDARHRILPYIAITALGAEYKCLFKDSALEKNDHSTNNLRHIFIKIEDGNIEYPTKPTEADCLHIERDIPQWSRDTATEENVLVQSSSINFPLQLENIGQGPALVLACRLNKNESQTFVRFQNIVPNEKRYINIYCINPTEKDIGKYTLDFCYITLSGEQVQQSFSFSTFKQGNGFNSSISPYAEQKTILSPNNDAS